MGYPMTELKSAQGVPCFSYFDGWDRLQPLMTLNWISIGKSMDESMWAIYLSVVPR